MKSIYTKPTMKIIDLGAEDVITTSAEPGHDEENEEM